MKFKSIFLTCAAGFALASCSSDEPGINAPETGFTGDTAYLTVNISDVGSAGRDIENGKPADDSFVFGDENEHAVDNAKFFFFDADGLYVNQASVWQASEDTNAPNVEYMGANVLVLKGLESNTTPTYMLTVLNAPADFQPTQGWTLDQTRNYLLGIKDNGGRFIMTTTSYDDNFGKLPNGSKIYGVNVLKESDFHKKPYGGSIDDKADPINVYVERLAAKIQVTSKMEGDKGYYKIPVTVAGNPNTEGTDDQGLTEVYVKFTNWGVNHYNEKSYLTKNIADFMNTNPWIDAAGNSEIWNSKDYFRSFWGKSYGYDNSFVNGDKLYTMDLEDAKNDFDKNNVAYVAEFNDAAANIIWEKNKALNDNKVTSVVFGAQIYEKLADNTYQPLDLVRFDGVLYRKNAFLNHVLSFLQYQNQLPYYKLVSATENKEEVENPDGTTTTVSTWEKKYGQMDAADLKLAVDKKVGAGTGIVYVYASNDLVGTTYYVKEAYSDKYVEKTFTQDDVDALNANLLKFYNGDESKSKGEAFNGGNMFYTIPVEHIVKAKGTDGAIVEGNYGVIRNHWYKIEVDKVFNIGHGVFDPGTDKEQGEELNTTEEDKDPTYYLRAQINILSWRIVSQKVDL